MGETRGRGSARRASEEPLGAGGTLCGLYFLVVARTSDGGEELRRQGRIAAQLSSGHYLIDVQEWALGRTVRQEVATVDQMRQEGWWLYPDMPSQQSEVLRRLGRHQRRA